MPVQNQGSLHTSQVSNLLPSFPYILSLITIKDTNSPHKYPFHPHPSKRAGSRANDIHLNVLTLLFLKRFPVPIVTKHLLSASLWLESGEGVSVTPPCALCPPLRIDEVHGDIVHRFHMLTPLPEPRTVKVSTKSWGIFTIFSLLKLKVCQQVLLHSFKCFAS